MTTDVKLYGYFRSSASWRVRIALNWKGVAYETVPVNMIQGVQRSDEYRRTNPLAALPTLDIDGHSLSESMAILEYLEETRPEPALLPKTPVLRAQARRAAEYVNSSMQPYQNLHVLAKLAQDHGLDEDGRKAWAKHFIQRGMDHLEVLLRQTAGRYSVGDDVSFADVVLVPQLYGARRWGIDVERYETIARVEAACAELPAFQAARPENQPDCPEGQR